MTWMSSSVSLAHVQWEGVNFCFTGLPLIAKSQVLPVLLISYTAVELFNISYLKAELCLQNWIANHTESVEHLTHMESSSSSSVVLSLASPTGNTDIQMVSQQEVLSVNNLHSVTPTKSKISYLGLGRQSQKVYSSRKHTELQAALFLSSKKHLWLGRKSLAYPSYIPVNNLVMLTSINLLNLLHIPKYKIAVTVQEKIHYVIRIWNQRIWSHFVQIGWVNLSN